MDLDLSEDQALIKSAVANLISRRRDTGGRAEYFLRGEEVERDLLAGGYLDLGKDGVLGPLDALLIVEEVAQLPFAIEVAASTLLGATVLRGSPLPRPYVLARAPVSGPIRFLEPRGTAFIVTDTDVRVVDLSRAEIAPVTTPFAYPYGKLAALDLDSTNVLAGVSPEQMLQWWRLGLAAEIGAAGRAAVEVTSEYVKTRRQFNRAIGSFQAVQHRLAACAATVEAIEICARRAAVSADPLQAAMAATLAQQGVSQLHHECMQFHGAMGITLEYPLHYWTYRLKALQGELGGAPDQALAAAAGFWPQAAAGR